LGGRTRPIKTGMKAIKGGGMVLGWVDRTLARGERSPACPQQGCLLPSDQAADRRRV